MPAKSKAQQRFFGMVHALQSGHLDTSKMPEKLKDKIQKTADSISKKDATKFATSSVSESSFLSFKEYLSVDVLNQTASPYFTSTPKD